MGINGLIPFLKNSDEAQSAIKKTHLSKFRGKRAAVDAHSWLHKSVYSCAQDLFLNKPTTKYVDYCLKNIKILQDHYVIPILVFDGAKMPIKVVNEDRREIRQKARKQATDLIAMGRMNEAFHQMAQSINITQEMVIMVIKAARKIGVECIIAPYEADAQLVYLEKQGLVDFIISEDSDLIIFGAKKVFFKMTPSAHGELLDADAIPSCLQTNKRIKNITEFTSDRLLYAAILSGCDYVKNLPGVGLIKAWKFITMTANTNIREFLKKLPSYLKMDVVIDDEYIEAFIIAVCAFKYQIVFDTRTRQRVTLSSDEDANTEDLQRFLSCFKTCKLDHLQLALGNIDTSNNQFDNYQPSFNSFLYGGNSRENIAEKSVEPKCNAGFDTSGIYKRVRVSGDGIDESVHHNNTQELEELALYLNVDVKVKTPVETTKEEITLPSPKRIKCKFLKNKPCSDENVEPLQSRFFKRKQSKETDDLSVDNTMEILESDKCSDPIINNKDDVPEIDDEPASSGGSTSNSQQSSCPEMSPVIEQKYNLSPVIEQKYKLSPVIEQKYKLKDIRNIQTFQKTKRKLMSKNQPTLLTFFNKL